MVGLVTEQWQPVLGWEDLYEVSDIGRVRSLRRRQGAKGGQILKTPLSDHGYQQLNLCRDGKPLHTFVHWLVAEAFHGARPPGLECRHLDGNRTNNRRENLAWGTASENNFDRVRHGTWTNMHSGTTHCIHGHDFDEANTRWVDTGKSIYRQCLACRRRRNQEQAARRKAARAARGVKPRRR